jgi:hypothetical protein
MMPPTSEGQLTLEKSPSYFVDRRAPGRIRRTLPAGVKLILVLREPVTRAISGARKFLDHFFIFLMFSRYLKQFYAFTEFSNKKSVLFF